ncbi:hypothetical protein [Devosia alba]|uniref:hypothetical protein n=1 Tax=Devosia alba TaxID=3152360 RepID=UPI003265E984
MASIYYRGADLATEAAAFAERITPAKDRWLYCLGRTAYQHKARNGEVYTCLSERTFPVCDRIIGCYKGNAASRLRKLSELGWDGAVEWVSGRQWLAQRPYFYVGPMEPWHVGHVYFARVESHPHVMKVGFSRRVRERIEDVESKCKVKLFVPPGHLIVGTMADEHFMHRTMKRANIAGEWFFDCSSADRSLPDFLQSQQERAA